MLKIVRYAERKREKKEKRQIKKTKEEEEEEGEGKELQGRERTDLEGIEGRSKKTGIQCIGKVKSEKAKKKKN